MIIRQCKKSAQFNVNLAGLFLFMVNVTGPTFYKNEIGTVGIIGSMKIALFMFNGHNIKEVNTI